MQTFPPRQDVLPLLDGPAIEAGGLLPLDSIYKSIYCSYVLRQQLQHGLAEGAPCEDILQLIVAAVGIALTNLASSITKELTSPTDELLVELTDLLNIALKEAVSEKVAAEYIPSTSNFVESVLSLLSMALHGPSTHNKLNIVYNCFAIALEASLKNSRAWETLKSHGGMAKLLEATWITSPNPTQRTSTVQVVKSICAVLPSLKTIDSTDLLTFFWQHILKLIPVSYTHLTLPTKRIV